MSALIPPSDAHFDATVHRVEMEAVWGGRCPDCIVGEPHACAVGFKAEQAKQRRLLAHFKEHMEIDAMFAEAAQ